MTGRQRTQGGVSNRELRVIFTQVEVETFSIRQEAAASWPEVSVLAETGGADGMVDLFR